MSFVPQEYQVMYLTINDRQQSQVQSITVMRTDGGADVATLARDYSGRVKGAAKADITVKGVIPYKPTDETGAAFSSTGIVEGGGNQLDQTMLTSQNTNSNQPVKFIVQVGSPAAQQLIFKGFIHTMTVDSAVGKQSDFSFQASGSFSIFG
jgi:hypothetical protein